MFPGFDPITLSELLDFFESRTAELCQKAFDSTDGASLSAETLAKRLLPIDDSALQWSTVGGGATEDPEQTLDELFERLLTRHQMAPEGSRTPA